MNDKNSSHTGQNPKRKIDIMFNSKTLKFITHPMGLSFLKYFADFRQL